MNKIADWITNDTNGLQHYWKYVPPVVRPNHHIYTGLRLKSIRLLCFNLMVLNVNLFSLIFKRPSNELYACNTSQMYTHGPRVCNWYDGTAGCNCNLKYLRFWFDFFSFWFHCRNFYRVYYIWLPTAEFMCVRTAPRSEKDDKILLLCNTR